MEGRGGEEGRRGGKEGKVGGHLRGTARGGEWKGGEWRGGEGTEEREEVGRKEGTMEGGGWGGRRMGRGSSFLLSKDTPNFPSSNVQRSRKDGRPGAALEYRQQACFIGNKPVL